MFSLFKFPRCFAIGAAAVFSLFAAIPQGQAHTISVGTFNAGGVGDVTVVLGSYHHSAPAEGAIQLTSGPVTTGVIAFTDVVYTKPGDLIDGTNNFFSPSSPGGSPAGTFNLGTNTTGQTAVSWQSVTFTGLTAGDYTYQITGMNSANWEDWGSLTNNWTGALTITGEVVAGIPEPGTLAVLGLGIIGLGLVRRRRAI